MIQKLGLILPLIIFSSLIKLTLGQTINKPEINVVYGDKHIFTIETPMNWVNDKEAAKKVGLVCFFYPNSEKDKSHLTYFYANGIDKASPNENLEDFIDADMKTFRKKYPDLTFEKVKVGFDGGLKNGVLYSFSKLTDRYKEEVLYGETDDSILIFSFSALTEEDYEQYQAVFDKFIASFNYRGNNPQPFLDYMNNRQK